MAYPLSSPIEISDVNPVEVSFNNTTGTVIWKLKSDVNDNLIIGTDTPASEKVIIFKPTSGTNPAGAAETPKLSLTDGTNTINLMTPLALSTTYDYRFPDLAPAQGQVQVSSGTAATTFADLNAKNTLVVRKNPAPGEFLTIEDALASIPVSPAANFPDFNNPWVISVKTGVYTENALVVPSYVYIVGESMEGVSVYQNGTGFALFEFSAPSGLAFLGIGNTDPNFPALRCDNCGDFLIFHKITVVENVDKFLSCVTDNTATENSVVYLEYVDTTGCTDYSILCQDTNIIGGFGSEVSTENFFTFEHNNDSIIADGLNSTLSAHATKLQSDGAGNCFRIKNGAKCSIRSTSITGYANGILIDNDSGTPNLIADGVSFRQCNLNINVLNDATTGQFTGYSEYVKTVVPKVAPFFITGKNHQIITVGDKGSDFKSVVTALASITDNSVMNRYTIYVSPGVYMETQIVMKPYVSIVGFFQTTCILLAHPSVAGTPFIIGAGYAALDKITISTASYATPPSYLIEFTGDAAGVHFRCDNVVLDNSADLVHIGTSSGPCIFLMLNSLINMSAPFVNGFLFEDSGPNNYPMIFTIDNMIWGADATGVTNVDKIVTIKSYASTGGAYQNISGVITGCSLGTNFYGPAGKGFCIEGSVYAVIDGSVFGGMLKGLEVLPSVEPTFLIAASCTVSNNTTDIDIQSSTAFGTINVNATLSKVFINDSASFGVQIHDEQGGLAFGGHLFQGIKWSEITNISEQIQHASSTGIIDSQPTLTDAGGLDITVGSGTGYVFFGPLTSNRLKYITWSSATLTLPNNALSWIYVDEAGIVTNGSTNPGAVSHIIIGTVKTFGGSITYIQEVGHILNNLSSNIDITLRDIYGPIVSGGCIASPGSDGAERAVLVSSGSYSVGVSKYSPTGGDNVTIIGYYGGTNETAAFTNIPLQYDNAGTLTAIPAGKWIKHTLHIISSLTGVTQYFLVYGQQIFDTELEAQEGPIPTQPTSFVTNMCVISGIIVTDSDPSSPLPASRFRDIRPTIGFRSDGVTASADHNSLLNLTVGDAHPQYFRVDGTNPMIADIDLDIHNIVGTGGNLLNGVDITNHGSRHVPGGADPLPTGVPVNVGAANSQGIAPSFARADHVHAGVASLAGTTNQVAVSGSLGSVTLSVPSTFNPPGTIQDTTGMAYSTSTSISATGSTQAAATPLTTSYNVVSTVAPNTGVLLPSPTPIGLRVVIVNRGANTLKVYPHVGGQIDGAAGNAPVEIPSGSTATYEASTSTQWYTVNPVLVAGSGATITYENGQNTISTNGVSTISGGTTGLTPSSPATGAIVLGGTLIAANGGTGFNNYTTGDILYAGGATTLSKLPAVATGSALISAGVSTAPVWGNIDLTTTVTNTLPVTNGGTGFNSYGIGDLLYADTNTTLAKLADVAQGNVLKSGGVGVGPSWGKVSLTNDTSGILPTTRGGTGLDSSTAGNGVLLIGNGSGFSLNTLTSGTGINISNTSGNITLSGTGVNSFSAGTTGLTPSSPSNGAIVLDGTLNPASGGTGLTTYTTGDIIYASGGSTLTRLPGVATGNALISGGVSTAPSWGKIGLTTHISGTLGAANGGTGLNSYAIGDLLYASGASTLTKLPAVVAGNALISNGVGAPPAWGKVNLSTTASGTLQAAQVPAFTGNVTSTGGSLNLSIANNAVTNVRLADMPTNTIKGNNTGLTADPKDLTTTEATAMLNLFTSTLKGLTPASGGGTTNFLRADGSWVNPSSGAAAGVNTNVQYNNGGSFGGSNAFNFVPGANPVVNIEGTPTTTQLTVGGTTNTGNSTSYIEVAASGSNIEGLRCYFNRGSDSVSGWITYDYDGATPNITLTDGDDDPPYIQFNIIGSGTYQAPQFSNRFGGRGGTGNGTTGFSWIVNGTEISAMDSQFFLPPDGTTVERPSIPSDGMFRYNTTSGKMEAYVPNVWSSFTGVINKSTTAQNVDGSDGSTNIISYSVPAGTLGTGNILRVRTSGIWSVNSNNRQVTITLSYGGTVLWQDSSGSQGSSQSGWSISFDLFATGSTSSQILTGVIVIGAGGNASTGIGPINTDEIRAQGIIQGTSSVNSNLSQTLVVSVNLNGGSQTWTKNIHTIELL